MSLGSSETQTLFHVTVAGHGPGDILRAGRYGFAAREYHLKHQPPDVGQLSGFLWEMTLETARLALAPRAVSRLECLFAAETMKMARAFRDRFRPQSTIYEITPWKDASLYRGDFGLISQTMGADPFIDLMPAVAVRYWTEAPGDQIEVLIGGPAFVVRIVEG